jgi:hypothetical protein
MQELTTEQRWEGVVELRVGTVDAKGRKIGANKIKGKSFPMSMG